MPKQNEMVPALVNRNILARELRISKSSLYRACESGELKPDFLMDGTPLFLANRITEIANLLKTPKLVC